MLAGRAHGGADRPYRRRRLGGRRHRRARRARACVDHGGSRRAAPDHRVRVRSTSRDSSRFPSSPRSRVRRARSPASTRRRCTSRPPWARPRWRCSGPPASSRGARGACRNESSCPTQHSCRPCGLDGCGGGKVSECLTTLPVERVHAALASLHRTKRRLDAPCDHPPALHAARRHGALSRRRAGGAPRAQRRDHAVHARVAADQAAAHRAAHHQSDVLRCAVARLGIRARGHEAHRRLQGQPRAVARSRADLRRLPPRRRPPRRPGSRSGCATRRPCCACGWR